MILDDGAHGEASAGRTEGSEVTAVRRRLERRLDEALAPLAAFGAVVAVGGTQGGYFPNSWGPSAMAMVLLVAAWLVLGARTDAGRGDAALVIGFSLVAAWIALSISWSSAPTQSILEVQRVAVLVAGVAAVLVLAIRSTYADVGLAIAAGISVLSCYALATRLFPDQLGSYNPIAGYRLSEPLGYWNGLGILAAIGFVLSAGVAVDARALWRRLPAAVSLVALAPTLYFTFSRGAWIALGFGVASMLILSSRRVETLAQVLVLTPLPLLGVLAASRSRALTRTDEVLESAVTDGRRLTVTLILLAVAQAALAVAVTRARDRVRLSDGARRTAGALCLLALVAGLGAVTIQYGAPWSVADRAWSAFKQPPAAVSGDASDLNNRLFNFSGSGRIDLWRSAVSTARSNPVLGVGAGAHERFWQQDPRWTFIARDAHSLYLETLAELGPVGLALILGLLAVPLVACIAARREPVVPAAFGALVAYAVHAGVDWDWELPVVTLAAFLAGSVAIISRRPGRIRRLPPGARWTAAVAVVLVSVVSVWGFLGNDSLDRAEYALEVGNPAAAIAESRHAERFAPWSPFPLTVRGEAFLALGQSDRARVAFRGATEVDDGYWRAWLGLAVASSGKQRTDAMLRAKSLYPRSREIAKTEALLRDNRAATPAAG